MVVLDHQNRAHIVPTSYNILTTLYYSQKLQFVDRRDYNTKQGHLIK